MLRSKWIGVALAIACSLIPNARAWAQQTAPPGPVDTGPAEPRTAISLAYAYFHDGAWDQDLRLGWVVTITTRIKGNFYLAGEIGGSHGEFRQTGFTIQRYAALAGVRLVAGEGRVRPFFQGLVGGTRQGGDVGLANGIAVQAGTGADLTLNDRFTFRVQGDYRWMLENDEIWTGYRLSGGIIFYLGKRSGPGK